MARLVFTFLGYACFFVLERVLDGVFPCFVLCPSDSWVGARSGCEARHCDLNMTSNLKRELFVFLWVLEYYFAFAVEVFVWV